MVPDDSHSLPPETTLAHSAEPAPSPVAIRGNEIPAPPVQPAQDDRQFPEDLRVPWGWTDLLLLILITVTGMFLISFFEIWVFGLFGISFQQIRSSAGIQGLFLIVNQLLLSLGVLLYLAAQMRVRFQSPFWRTIGWRPLETSQIPRRVAYLGFVLAGILLSMLVSFVSGLFVTKTKLPIEALLQDRWSAVFFLLLSVTIGPVFEETVFRGYIYPVLARSLGVTAGIFGTGIFFGLLHAQQLWGGWPQIVSLVVVGIVFTYVRAVTRTVVASYLLHLSYNSFLFIAFLVGTHGLRHFPPGP
jgi:membrane protease YdiL (CAAX protease family)